MYAYLTLSAPSTLPPIDTSAIMTVFEPQHPLSYQQEDVQQILNLAIARQADGGELSRVQLMEIAAEIGISAESIQAAEREWLLQQEDQQKRREFNLYRRNQLRRHLGKYLIVNSFLVVLNWLSAGQLSWSLYIALTWGLVLGLNAWSAYQSEGEEYERAFQKWYRRQQLTQVAHSIYSRVNQWIKASI